MKKWFTVLLLLCTFRSIAQDSLSTYNFNREHIKKTGMEVLGSWAIANIAVGAISSGNNTGSAKYFYQMNALWNVVNLGAAVSGFISTEKASGKTLTPAESLREQKKIETIFLVNGALDLVYIGGGIYLNHRGNNDNSDKLRGYGSGIIIQGTFLLLFDATMYSNERANGNKLRNFLQKNQVVFDGKKIGMVYHF